MYLWEAACPNAEKKWKQTSSKRRFLRLQHQPRTQSLLLGEEKKNPHHVLKVKKKSNRGTLFDLFCHCYCLHVIVYLVISPQMDQTCGISNALALSKAHTSEKVPTAMKLNQATLTDTHHLHMPEIWNMWEKAPSHGFNQSDKNVWIRPKSNGVFFGLFLIFPLSFF